MRNDRFKNGAINFSSQEVRFKLDEKNKPIGIMIKESKEAHQLIEEFMLLANRTVAENLGKIKINNKFVLMAEYTCTHIPMYGANGVVWMYNVAV